MANNQAGERTEKPTQKRQKDARERGQMARSRRSVRCRVADDGDLGARVVRRMDGSRGG